MKKDYFEHIYLQYFKELSLFSARIVGDISAAEDIVQDVFFECWSRRNKIDTSTSIKPYLYKLTYNRSLDFLKRLDNKNLNIGDGISELDNLFYSTFIQDDQLHTDEISKEIINCINLLPEKCKQVFILSRHNSLKNREIAEELDISIKTVEKHISKALQEIREHLLKAGYLLEFLIILSSIFF